MSRNQKHQVSVLFLLFCTLFCVCLIAANLLETKQIAVWSVSLTGGLLVFPVSYIINDCVCEVYGYQKARLLIWLGFLMNFFFVLVGALCDWIPGADYWDNDAGFHAVFDQHLETERLWLAVGVPHSDFVGLPAQPH